MARITRHKNGFTLLEMSIVLLILSLMLGGVLAALTQDSRIRQKEQLKMKMDTIEQALLAYVKKSSTYALPCPAAFVAQSNAGFGAAAASGCATLTYTDGTTASGSVPVRTLGLSDDFAFDPWGNLFTYSVSTAAATTNALSTTYPTKETLGTISMTDTVGSTITTVAIATLVSHGPDGFGSFTREGTRKAGYSSNANQQTNCHCTAAAANGTYAATFVIGANAITAGDAESGFDDIVRFYGREFFMIPTDLTTEKF